MKAKIKCKECGKEFTMTKKEVSWFAQRGFEMPKRCPECRKARKLAKEQKENKG